MVCPYFACIIFSIEDIELSEDEDEEAIIERRRKEREALLQVSWLVGFV